MLDDDNYLGKPVSEGFGQIEVQIWRAEMFHNRPQRQSRRNPEVTLKPPSALADGEKVHERSKKAMAHRIQYVTAYLLD